MPRRRYALQRRNWYAMLTDATLIALFHERGHTVDLARREGITTRQLKSAWQRLRRAGQLPLERHNSTGGLSAASTPVPKVFLNDEHAFDGRPSVNLLVGSGDPLLDVLRARGHAYLEPIVSAPGSPPIPGADETAAVSADTSPPSDRDRPPRKKPHPV